METVFPMIHWRRTSKEKSCRDKLDISYYSKLQPEKTAAENDWTYPIQETLQFLTLKNKEGRGKRRSQHLPITNSEQEKNGKALALYTPPNRRTPKTPKMEESFLRDHNRGEKQQQRTIGHIWG